MRLRLVFPLTMDVSSFDEIAAEQSWPEIANDQPEDEDTPAKTWQVPGGTLRFVDDELLQVQYIDVAAEPPEPVVAVIEQRFTGYDRDYCLAALDLGKSEAEVTHAIRLLAAVAAGPFDQRVYDATTAALHDEREKVRYWALKVANYTRWVQFLDEARWLELDTQVPALLHLCPHAQLAKRVCYREGTRGVPAGATVGIGCPRPILTGWVNW